MTKKTKIIASMMLGLALTFSFSGDGEAAQDQLKAKLLEIQGLAYGETRYFSGLIDLNGDGRLETIAYVAGPFVCGTGGCSTFVFTPENGGLRLVAEISLTRPPIAVSQMKTHGWRDIIVHVSGGGLPSAYNARLRFDGTRYPANPTIAPAEHAEENVKGTVLIKPFQSYTEGKLLRRADE